MRLLTVAVLLALPARAAPADDWFHAYQYSSHAMTLRGCSDCKGEHDDVCEIPSGVLVQPMEEYAKARWPAPGRVKLLRSKADPDCAVTAAGSKGLFAGRSGVEVAAIRLGRAPPPAALVERFADAAAVRGWPVAAARRKAEQTIRFQAQRSAVRLGVVCWPSEQGWPTPTAPGPDGRSELGPANSCELWLLPVKPQTGEPDLSGVSFPASTAFSASDARWVKAFDRNAPLDDSIVPGESAPQMASTAEAPQTRPAEAAVPPAPIARCGEAARRKTATLERFEQWEAQILGAGNRSLDREGFTLSGAAWSGHCQEMDVLRAALEQQLGCTVLRKGPCLLASGQPAAGAAAVTR